MMYFRMFSYARSKIAMLLLIDSLGGFPWGWVKTSSSDHPLLRKVHRVDRANPSLIRKIAEKF